MDKTTHSKKLKKRLLQSEVLRLFCVLSIRSHTATNKELHCLLTIPYLCSMISWDQYTREFKYNFRLAWPVMVGYLGQVLVGLADNIMVGKLGPVALATISLANSTIFFVMSFGIGFSSAITPLVSEALGLNDKNRLHKIFYNGLIANTLTGIVMVAIIYAVIPLLPHAKQPPEVVALAVPYIRWVGFSVLLVMIFQAMKQFSDGLGLTKISMHAILITNVINIAVSYVLIYGVGFFPRLGVLGAGLGTVFARLVIIGIFWILLYRHPATREFVSKLPVKVWDSSILKKIFSLGFPSGYQSVFEMGIFTASVWLAGMLGTVAQAANQIALQMASMTFMVFVGLGVAATVRVGYRYGKKEYVELRRIAFSVFMQAALIGLFFSLLYIAFRHQLPWIYLSRQKDDPQVFEVARLAAELLIIAGLFQISDSLQVTAQGALRGLQDVKIPVMITFVSYWLIGFPVAWFGAKTWGVHGIWIGLFIGLTVAAVLLIWRFHVLTKRLIKSSE